MTPKIHAVGSISGPASIPPALNGKRAKGFACVAKAKLRVFIVFVVIFPSHFLAPMLSSMFYAASRLQEKCMRANTWSARAENQVCDVFFFGF